ncbi:helix-turn-helix transcriptional regulator [Streptomyces pseudogriseolus]|uniref:helix-turn-helix transcriptional regulator n=1 Tax=Streptomyces pseudogriseolus TaxID=36817 RepID=UPI003FA269BB
MPLTDVAPGHTRMYLSQSEVAERLGLSRTHVGRLVRTGLFPTPDVWIASYLNGWSEDRTVQFGKDAGILDDNGVRRIDPETGRPVALTDGARTRTDRLRGIITEKYNEPPATYLGTALIAALYQQAPAAIYTTRNRVRFIPADVVICTRFGWDEERILEFGHQAGKFKTDNRPDEWAVERTVQHKLPAADWATDRIVTRIPEAAAEVVAALKDAGHPVPRRLINAAKATA